MIRALSWNLFHGRDFPPDPALRTLRSRVLRVSERSATHLQVNRDLFAEFASVLCSAAWDVALLQECPPRWVDALAARCAADPHVSLTSRNSLAPLRSLLARANPDLIGSAEGGSNATLVRCVAEGGRSNPISERREFVLTTRPERRTMVFTGLTTGLCLANLHASNAAPAAGEALAAAARATGWAGDRPLIFGGDLNLRPDRAGHVFAALSGRHGLTEPTEPDAIDHMLVRGLDVVELPARWSPERREVDGGGGLAIRLSDHAPVEAAFDWTGRGLREGEA